MRILSVGIKNLNSLKLETNISFDKPPIANSGLFAITGDTGAGKSTILDALTLGLYGRVHRNKDVKEVMSYGATDSYAEIEFSVKNEIYRAKWNIWRARGNAEGNILGPNRELAKWNSKKKEFEIIAEKIREVDESVEAITGLDYDRFSRSVVLSQGDFAAFLKAGEKERSDLLERITGTEIYSELSKAAFDRYKLEKDKLDDLQKSLENLQLLGKAELKELKQNQKDLSKEAKSQHSTINEFRTIIQWFEQIQKLETRKSKLELDFQKVEEEREAIQPDLDLLAAHQKTIPFQNRVEKISDLSAQINVTNDSLSQLKSTGLHLQEKVQSSKISLDTFQNQLNLLKEEWTAKSPLIDQVIALDIEIKEKEIPFLKRKEELLNIQEQKNKKETRLGILNNELLSLSKTQTETQEWLKNNAQLKSIVDDLPRIEQHYANLRIEYKKKEDGKVELKELKFQIDELDKQKKQLEKSIANANKDLNDVLSDFKKTAPEYFVQSRGELLNKLTEDIDQLSNSNKNLQQLKIFNDQYQELLEELNDYESKLEHLKQEEVDINSRVLSALEALDALSLQLEFKQQVYDQQNLIANYEKDRFSLKEGEPCPLCFSETHPFREHKLKPFIDQASKELEQTKKQYDLVLKDYRVLLNRQKDIEIKIETLAGNEVKALSGSVKSQFNKIIQFEERIMKIAPDLAVEDFALARQNIINRRIFSFEKQLADLKTTRQKLIKLDLDLSTHEQKVKEQENQKAIVDLNLVKENEQYKLLLKQLTEAEQNFENHKNELNSILKLYQKSFDIDTGKETLNYLGSLKLTFESNLKKENEIKGKIELTIQEKTQLQEQVIEVVKTLEVLEQEIDKSALNLTALKSQRTTLFGADDPVTLKKELQERINSTELQTNEANILWNKANLDLQTNTTQITEIEKQLNANSTNLEKLNSSLIEAISKSGFENLDQLKAAILTNEVAEAIKKKQEDLTNKSVAIQQDFKTISKELIIEKDKNLSKEEKDIINKKLFELDAQYQQVQQKIGALNEILKQNEQRKVESKKLFEDVENQRKEFNRWAKLNDIIGQADGKKFRVFAQGLTLKKLAVIANEHLQQLNGRYFILKRNDEDLSLEIVDTYQADNVRSMNTLSGGESFLVSLSLALGLSDLAGRNTNINSLFIDEGFGTLDESTLDMAISTLENLQSSGKTIGIISHVKELKERISTQIIIKKAGNGFSKIEII
jgi:DNA repair protein SbcC/Rad50